MRSPVEGWAHFLTVSYSLDLGPVPFSFSGFCLLTLHFYVLLNGELGEGLFNAQGCEAGGSVCIPTLPHDFAYDSQSLKQAQSKSNVIIYMMISM